MAEQDEALKNCGFCKKAVTKAKRYYRNSKYYCTPNCWNKAQAAAKKAAAEEAE